MFGLSVPDFIMLLIYLVGITIVGLWTAKGIKSVADFSMGGRRFGTAFMIMHNFGTGTHSSQAVTVAAKTYTNGLSGIWYHWFWLFITPFYWLTAPIFRRLRGLTTGDYFEARYDRSVSGLYAAVAMLMGTGGRGVAV